jgi:ABC-type dipeptide/oligopeptide/nickel transport system permease subunit
MPIEPASPVIAEPSTGGGLMTVQTPRPGSSIGAIAFRRLMRNPRSLASILFILLVIVVAILAPVLAPYSFKEQFRGNENHYLTTQFMMGTDSLARDILSRVIYGARISMFIGICATAMALLIGVNVGLIAGYYGGVCDACLMRLTDTVAAFPSLLLALAITAIWEKPSITIVFVSLGIVGWTGIARIVRAEVLMLKTLDYVSAARALGLGNTRIMFRHILPNCLSPIIVVATLGVAGNILGEAGLSFLGLGVQDPFPSWGGMLSDARQYFVNYWWEAVFPGLAIVLTVLAFNLLGDSLRDALDPKKVG